MERTLLNACVKVRNKVLGTGGKREPTNLNPFKKLGCYLALPDVYSTYNIFFPIKIIGSFVNF